MEISLLSGGLVKAFPEEEVRAREGAGLAGGHPIINNNHLVLPFWSKLTEEDYKKLKGATPSGNAATIYWPQDSLMAAASSGGCWHFHV